VRGTLTFGTPESREGETWLRGRYDLEVGRWRPGGGGGDRLQGEFLLREERRFPACGPPPGSPAPTPASAPAEATPSRSPAPVLSIASGAPASPPAPRMRSPSEVYEAARGLVQGRRFGELVRLYSPRDRALYAFRAWRRAGREAASYAHARGEEVLAAPELVELAERHGLGELPPPPAGAPNKAVGDLLRARELFRGVDLAAFLEDLFRRMDELSAAAGKTPWTQRLADRYRGPLQDLSYRRGDRPVTAVSNGVPLKRPWIRYELGPCGWFLHLADYRGASPPGPDGAPWEDGVACDP